MSDHLLDIAIVVLGVLALSGAVFVLVARLANL